MVVSEEAGLRKRTDDDEQLEEKPESHKPLTMDTVPLSAEIDDANNERKRPYLPSCYNVYHKIKGSIYLAFLSHLFFILASILYLKLALVTLNWYLLTKRLGVPEDVLDEDTDEVWTSWTSENGADYILDKLAAYRIEYELLYILGALFFAIVGLLDLIRFFDFLNIVLVLAGIAGMVSALSTSYEVATTWDFISVHLFVVEAINLLLRHHDYEGVACFRIGDICFLMGALLDCIGSYVGIAGREGLWVIQMDVFACCLWLLSALTDITAEIFYLRKHVGDDGIIADVQCY